MEKIKEVIVVEGRDDTKRIKMAVDCDTIETRGSAIDEKTLALIKKLDKQRGVIVFTDPDFSGERIRKIITQEVPNAKHAFVDRKKSVPTKSDGSLGVEHASVETIRDALKNVYTADTNHESEISVADLKAARVINDSEAKIRRTQLCNELKIGYVNGKQLLKRLSMFGITKEQFNEALSNIKE
ncbi:Ribonuclease M5 [Apilactobacillus kunkeei]|uniref:ribonuclease M5 n=1 Tax=Apilactobacillus kunkeei TaxID=148814 RepID=UPI00200B0FE7|nr:ribonuclease M5 [Apilactobacillus kunkeei]MCK8620744.1 ribonuclease M5 [Apilactobacillus kunkeei]CAI2566380.1 Ribonuclease M5 [Apilactobacillus kunkeei]CAI2566490.1 Ribonuclease M5 [Apilactobacillus kunkeei]